MREVAGSVVVGYDGSAEAEAAVDWAAAEASRQGKPLVVAYGADYSGMLIGVGGMGSWFPEPAQQAAEAIAEEGAQRARKTARDIEVTSLARIHSPAAVLKAASETAALVVVGTRGRGTVAGTLLGSVAFSVCAAASCPVVVVRGTPSQQPGPGRPVVVGVDGSEQAAAALDLGADRAADHGADLHLITAWQAVAGEAWAAAYWDANFPGRNPADVVREAAEKLLEAAKTRVLERQPGLAVRTIAGEGAAVRVLGDASDGAGLLVVGARGRGDVASLLLGSVSRGVLNHAKCPVEVVRAQ